MRVYKPHRKKWTPRQMLAIFDSSNGCCHWCGVRIRGGEAWTPDHVVRLADGGADSIENVRPIHRRCHEEKTGGEARRGAKADRQAARHLGVTAQPKRPFPGSKASGWRKRINGTVERRK